MSTTTWGEQLTIIRRFLRDPAGVIWSEAFLRHLWNDVQQDFQHRTDVLEDVIAQRVPGLYQASYLYDWEWRFQAADQSQFYQALTVHDDGAVCHSWEAQELTGIDADSAEYGVHVTQPWELCMGQTPGEPIKIRFPRNCNVIRWISYDEEPIEATSRKQVQSIDASYLTTQGIPYAYYVWSATDNSYVLYPRPSTTFVNELSGDGLALHADGDTEDLNTGQIAVRTPSTDSEVGGIVDLIDATDNVLMVYTVSPTAMTTVSDVPDYPPFLCKYIRAGVIGRAYGANTDGYIGSLGDLWMARYMLGVKFVRNYMRNKRQDRNYRLVTRDAMARRSFKHPRLPDRYPSIDP